MRAANAARYEILIAHNAVHRGREGEGQGGPAAAGPGHVALAHQASKQGIYAANRERLRSSSGLTEGHFPVGPVHLVQIPFRWAALRGRYYVHLVQMHGPFPNSVRVGPPLFGGLS